jgi:N-terminal domain of anti-restriction factor ArdC
MSTSIKRLSPEEARRFDHFSVHNAIAAEAACPTLECRAYSDIFTFRRWLAQGYVVKKGERGTKVTTWIPVPEPDEGEQGTARRTRPKTAVRVGTRWNLATTARVVSGRDGTVGVRRRPCSEGTAWTTVAVQPGDQEHGAGSVDAYLITGRDAEIDSRTPGLL